ncbi:MAG: phosphopantothenoylcysteine decarboxylase [Lentisphaerae bacterium]|nr:phosphopantothenoylcysteine decarboxylase [Lentisphaerota bacterium]
MANPPCILLGVTGSIAAYRAAELVRLMIVRGWDVHVIMTRSATEFVGKLTFQTLSRHPVGVEQWGDEANWRPEHIALADRADVFVIAPCTANVMAKLACGIADDLLTSTVLACQAPLVVAPAMNVHMWEHPATQANLKILQARGVRMIDVAEGDLACGYQGKGRLAPVDGIVEVVQGVLDSRGSKP